MKKVGIVTIIDNNNYGNRLQNYALSLFCEKNLKVKTYTLINEPFSNTRRFYILRILKNYIKSSKKYIINESRSNNFKKFNMNINFYHKKINAYTNLNEFDYVITGSDQVWNPTFNRLRDVDLLRSVKPNRRISYSASFGVSKISSESEKKVKKELRKFKYISVRENEGKNIIEKVTDRKDVEVLIDPTMLLSSDEWEKVSQMPEQYKNEKYILNYFLGDLSEERKEKINSIAKAKGWKIINILNKADPYYASGPSEFLWLEQHAELICTDSFHSSVFSIIYEVPFIVFMREGKQESMNSRLDTLLHKFELQNRRFKNDINEELLNVDYSETKRILKEEKQKSVKFLEKAINMG